MGLLHSLRFEPPKARLKVTKMVAFYGTLATLAGIAARPRAASRRAVSGFSQARGRPTQAGATGLLETRGK